MLYLISQNAGRLQHCKLQRGAATRKLEASRSSLVALETQRKDLQDQIESIERTFPADPPEFSLWHEVSGSGGRSWGRAAAARDGDGVIHTSIVGEDGDSGREAAAAEVALTVPAQINEADLSLWTKRLDIRKL